MTEQPGITFMNSHVTKECSAVRLWLSAIAVFLIAIVVRAAFLIRNGVVTTLDTVDYVTIAQNLMGHGVFSLSTSFPYIPTIRRPPLYSFFLAAVSPGLTAILLQVALDAACALGVYFLTLSAGRIKQALTAGLFYAFYPSAIVASCSLMSEALFSFTLVTAVVFLVLGIRRDAPSASIAGSVCLGLTILCRPIAGAYLIALVATLIASGTVPRRYLHSAILLVGATSILSPWLARCYAVSGRFVFVQGFSAINVYVPTMMELDQADEVVFWPWPHLAHTPYGSRLDKANTPAEMVEADHFGVAEALRNIRHNPRGYVRLRLRTLPHLFLSSFDSFTGIDRSFRQLLASRDVPHITVKFLMMAVFSVAPLILGVFGLPSIRCNSVALLCASIWLTTLVVHMPMWIESRFWLPAVPFLLVNASCGFAKLVERPRSTSVAA